MSDNSIKAVLFDYGGVIADEGFQNALRAIADEQGLDLNTVMGAAKYAVYDSGLILGWGSEAALWDLMRQRAGLRGDDGELTERVLEGFVLRPWMIETVQRLRSEGYVTGILSDQTRWLDWLNERDGFFRYFDHVFNSWHMGKGKRDPSLFPEIGKRLSLSPGEILFVDDLKGNVLRAEAAGWRAIRYMDKEGFIAEIDGILNLGAR